MAAPAVSLYNVRLVAQETGTPGSSNPYHAAEFAPSAGAAYAQPPAANDTRSFDAFAADLGFTWDDGLGGILGFLGDGFGFDWTGPNTTFGGATTNSTIAAGSDGLHLKTLTGTQTLSVAASAGTLRGKIVAIMLQSGHLAFLASTTNSGTTTLVNCTYIGATGGETDPVCHTGDVIRSGDLNWAGLTNRSDVGWRSQTCFRSTDADLTAGYTISDFRPQSSAGTARQPIASNHSAVTAATVYTTPVTFTNVHGDGFLTITVDATGHGRVAGEWFQVAGNAVLSDGEYRIHAVPDSDHFTVLGGSSSSSSAGTIKAATFSSVARPTLGTEASKLPTGGIAIPGIGAGGAVRQVLFYESTNWFSAGGPAHWFANYMGQAYSDDDGQTWTNVASDTTVAAASNGQAANALTSGNLFMATLPTLSAGGCEVDTSTGIAVLRYTGTSTSGGNHLTGVTWVSGATGTVATSNGVRFNLWGQNATYTAPHMAGWPWRPGDGYVYVLTNMNGRYGLPTSGGARMMRVAESSILDISAYQYFTGFSGSVAQWSNDRTAATNVFPDANPVGEPSFTYHTGTGLYVASYKEENWDLVGSSAIVIRTASEPYGPWSSSAAVIPSSSFPGGDLYGGFIHPWSNVGASAAPTGPSGTVTTSVSSGAQSNSDFYFHISLFGPYSTYLVQASVFRGAGRISSRSRFSGVSIATRSPSARLRARELTRSGAPAINRTGGAFVNARTSLRSASQARAVGATGTMSARAASHIASAGRDVTVSALMKGWSTGGGTAIASAYSVVGSILAKMFFSGDATRETSINGTIVGRSASVADGHRDAPTSARVVAATRLNAPARRAVSASVRLAARMFDFAEARVAGRIRKRKVHIAVGSPERSVIGSTRTEKVTVRSAQQHESLNDNGSL